MAVPTARSISEVSKECKQVELRGTVQTVFPIHACVQASAAADSETQDVSWAIGTDGPLEGRDKVFQVTLRDLSAGRGGLHLINAYFYDNWADTYSRLISKGDDVAMSASAARVVRPDPSAGTGDHPFCLAFCDSGEGRDSNDDDGCRPGSAGAMASRGHVIIRVGAAATPAGGGGRGGRCGEMGGGGGRDGDGRRGGRQQSRGSGAGGATRAAKNNYVYTKLASLQRDVYPGSANVYGVVCSFGHPRQSSGSDLTASVTLLDETRPVLDQGVTCNFFRKTRGSMPCPIMVGDIIRIHRAKLLEYMGRPQLTCNVTSSQWIIIRNKRMAREIFQKVPPPRSRSSSSTPGGVGVATAETGDDVDDLEPDDDEDSLQEALLSGPDAGGGGASRVLPPGEWKVDASSYNYTMDDQDRDRCYALVEWFTRKSSVLWLKPSGDVKTWVLDTFGKPDEEGPELEVKQVDLVCCLACKGENQSGGAGSLDNLYVADGTGYEGFKSKVAKSRLDAAFLKGMRYALQDRDWKPPVGQGEGGRKPPPSVAYLFVVIENHRKECEALALSPGMWIRLRRLTITKNKLTGFMSAKIKDHKSSINPLHPRMAEVQAIAAKYAERCAAHASGTAPRVAPAHPSPAVPAAPASGAAAAQSSPANKGSNVNADVSNNINNNNNNNNNSNNNNSSDSSNRSHSNHSSSSSNTIAQQQQQQQQSRSFGGGDALPASPGYVRRPEDAVSGRAVSPGPRGGAESEGGRGTKRPLHAGVTRQSVGPTGSAIVGAGGRGARGGRRQFSNLLAAMAAPAPHTCDVRVRVVGHSPPKVKDFVQQGPGASDAPNYLFSLHLEDDYATLEALGAGPNAGNLFPGRPSPELFASSEDTRRAVASMLEKAETGGDSGGGSHGDDGREEGGGGRGGRERSVMELRLRSYVVPRARGDAGVKRYTIVGPAGGGLELSPSAADERG